MELLLLTLWLENPAVLGERAKMVVVAPLQEGKSQLAARTSGLAGHFQVPLSSCLWLSHPDGCFLGGCTRYQGFGGESANTLTLLVPLAMDIPLCPSPIDP